MKIVKFIVALMLVLTSVPYGMCQNSDVITNQKVIELSRQKLGTALIIELFNANTCEFKTDVNSILELKRNNVSEDIIHAMLKHSNGKSSSSNAGTGRKNTDKKSSDNRVKDMDTGIHIKSVRDGKETLSKLYPSVVSGTKSGGFGAAMANSFTYGFSKSGVKSEIGGVSANVWCGQDAVFYFNFDNSGNGFGIFNIASSPNEFVLIRLTLNKKRTAREFRSGTSNSYENSSGLDDDQRIPFTFEEIKSGVFVVKTSENLRSGEYCFLYAAQAGSEQNGNKVFDFTVE